MRPVKAGIAVYLLFLSALSCTGQVSPSSDEKKASYLTIQVPGAQDTVPVAINDSLVVTGYYLLSPTVARAFIQNPDGAVTTFSVPDSEWTEPASINAAGDITGAFGNVAGAQLGFLRYANGLMVKFGLPANHFDPAQTVPVAINDFDEIAGNYPFPFEALSGFTRSRAGVIMRVNYADGGNYPTVLTDLNGSGTVIGIISGGGPNYQSFILHPDGNFDEFDVPVISKGYVCDEASISSSINTTGVIAGSYWGDSRPSAGYSGEGDCTTTFAGGFLRSPRGGFTLFNAPGSIVASPLANSLLFQMFSPPNRIQINRQGTVTGSYTDSNSDQHGFVRESNGAVISFDPPGGMQTTPTGINASGVIVGSFFYHWDSQKSIGFIRIPAL